MALVSPTFGSINVPSRSKKIVSIWCLAAKFLVALSVILRRNTTELRAGSVYRVLKRRSLFKKRRDLRNDDRVFFQRPLHQSGFVIGNIMPLGTAFLQRTVA